MTYSVYDESPLARIPRKVRDVLAADAGLVSFFEGRISECDREEIENPQAVPSLWIVPSKITSERQVGGLIDMRYEIGVIAVLPRLTPAVAGITAPSAPTVAAASGGALTGTYKYRLTAFGTAGESFASASASAAPSAQAVTVTPPALPSGATGFRVWRTRAGRDAYRWVKTLYGTAAWTDTVVDTALGDELAPIRYYGERLIEEIARVLYVDESFTDSGECLADQALFCEPGPDRVIAARNLRFKSLRVSIPTQINPETKEVTVCD